MRVAGGKYRGRKLFEITSGSIRPTSDKVKQAVFNIFQNTAQDCVFLDLFCGSGAIGFEALSRGAKDIFMVDTDISVARKNSVFFEPKPIIIESDFIRALQNFYKTGQKFDIIYIDPPFGNDFEYSAVSKIYEYDLMNKNACIVIESGKPFKSDKPVRTIKYGSIYINIIYNKEV